MYTPREGMLSYEDLKEALYAAESDLSRTVEHIKQLSSENKTLKQRIKEMEMTPGKIELPQTQPFAFVGTPVAPEQKSSVEISKNAKGDLQYNIKVYDLDPNVALEKALALKVELEGKIYGGKDVS